MPGDLLASWQGGDQQAATELFQRYAGRLVALVRNRLSPRLARRIDPEDVVQSAYRCFFAEARDCTLVVNAGQDLWQLLATFTLHKLQRQVQWHSAQKRALAREHHFGSEDTLFRLQPHLAAPEPSPAEAVALVADMEQLLEQLDASERLILELRLDGCKLTEIAARAGCTERTVRRILDRIRQQLGHWLAEQARS
ncbi:hypothetical protein AYO44_16270 [Planctomycetaceae bacterium SCGC AG-212-F19]|nr:hypothetical protein AYO44_16270 [Planctomycetaceae bacterium SCGC AG-212-F19]